MRTENREQFAYLPAQLSLDKARKCTRIFPVTQAHFTISATIYAAVLSNPQFPSFTKLTALQEDNKVHIRLLQYRKEGGEKRNNLIHSLSSFFQDIPCNQKSHALLLWHRRIYKMQIIFLKLHVHINLTSAPFKFIYLPSIHTRVLHGSSSN